MNKGAYWTVENKALVSSRASGPKPVSQQLRIVYTRAEGHCVLSMRRGEPKLSSQLSSSEAEFGHELHRACIVRENELRPVEGRVPWCKEVTGSLIGEASQFDLIEAARHILGVVEKVESLRLELERA